MNDHLPYLSIHYCSKKCSDFNILIRKQEYKYYYYISYNYFDINCISRKHESLHTHSHTQTHTYTHTQTHTHIHSHTQADILVYIGIYMHIYNYHIFSRRKAWCKVKIPRRVF
jgi:hypothetical protein